MIYRIRVRDGGPLDGGFSTIEAARAHASDIVAGMGHFLASKSENALVIFSMDEARSPCVMDEEAVDVPGPNDPLFHIMDWLVELGRSQR